MVAGELAARLPSPAASGRRPAASRFSGAALVADASGFTALAASLEARYGGRGADRLAAAVSELLGRAMESVIAEGGLVVDLVGDAFQAVWLDEGAGLEDCRRRAAAAAALITGADGAPGLEGLTLRVGVGSGAIDAAIVGGVGGRWDTLAWGPALQQAALGSPTADAPAARRGRGRLKAAGASQAIDPELLMPAVLRTLDDPAALAWSAELRVVSVVFCRLAPAASAIDIDEVHGRVRQVQEIAARLDGVFDKAIADEKGVAAILVFGTGPSRVEGAAERAAAAALELAAGIEGSAVGVSTGKVYMGVIGGEARGQYTLLGAAANRAARLMAAAGSGAVCDGATREAAGAAALFEPVEVVAKGLGEIRAFRLSPAPEPETGPGPVHGTLPGRARELAAITEFGAASGKARVLAVLGAAGLGKSALAAAGEQAAERSGRPVLHAAPAGHAVREPLHAWRRAARARLRARATAAGQGEDQAVVALAADAGVDPGLATLAAPLFRAGPPEGARARALSAEDRVLQARRVQAALLLQLTGPGALLVIDDGDRIDEASLALAEELLRLDPGARVLVSARERTRAVEALIRRPGAETLALEPLDRPAVAQLAQAFVPVAADHPLADWLYERCRGNPHLARELLAALPAQALAEAAISPGAWREAAPQLRLAELPPTVEAAVLARISRQTPQAQTVLKAASIAEGWFDAQGLAVLGLPLEREAIARALDALVEEGVLAREDGRYSFPQDLVRATLHEALPQALRKDLHGRAAEALERARWFGRAAEIGRHWRIAERPRRAFAWLRRAGRAAMASGAYGDAAALFEQCVAIEREAPLPGPLAPLRRARLMGDLAAALGKLSEREGTIAAGYTALAAVGERPPPDRRGWGGYALKNAAALALRVARGAPPRPGLKARYRAAVQFDTAHSLSDMLFFRFGTWTAVSMSLLAVRAAEEVGDLVGAARPYALLGYAAGVLRLEPLARWCLERPRAAALAAQAWPALVYLAGGRTWLELAFGRWAGVEAGLAELEGLRASSSAYDLRLESEIIARTHWLAGRIDQAQREFDRLGALAADAGDDQHLAWAVVYTARRLLWAGEVEAAERAYDEARRLQARRPDKQVQAIIAGHSSLARIRLGRAEEVARDADAMLELASDQAAWPTGTTDGLAALAEAMIALNLAGPSPAAAARVRRALANAKAFAGVFPLGAPPFALAEGAAAAAQGRWRGALGAWRRGLRQARRLGLPMEEARLLDALAVCPALPGPERERARAVADAIAARCGSPIPPRLYEAHA
jgi:class 3 adenylate cyclase